MQIPADTRFPHLAIAFNTVWMGAALQAALFGMMDPNFTIIDCKIDETVYKPGKRCVLVYRLSLVDAAGAWARQQWVCVRLCQPGEGAAEYARAQDKRLVESSGMKALAYLAELEMVAWTFPNDPVLTRLPDMLDINSMQSLLPRKLTELGLSETASVKGLRTEVLHYRAEQTCILRYRLERDDPTTGRVNPLIIYGKIYANEQSTEVFRLMTRLNESSPGLVTARPLGYDTELNAVWQSHVPGEPLNLKRTTPKQCRDAMEQIAGCVAALHNGAVDGIREVADSQIVSQLAKTVAVVDRTYPQIRERVAGLVRQLLERATEIDFDSEAVPAVPIHRDLKPTNFLLDGYRAALIDLDDVGLGDPLIDLGSFIVAFSSRAFILGWNETVIDAALDSFLQHYARRVAWPVKGKRLDWYVAASFVYESVHRSVRQWDVDKLRNVPRWLDFAERYAYATTTSGCAASALPLPHTRPLSMGEESQP